MVYKQKKNCPGSNGEEWSVMHVTVCVFLCRVVLQARHSESVLVSTLGFVFGSFHDSSRGSNQAVPPLLSQFKSLLLWGKSENSCSRPCGAAYDFCNSSHVRKERWHLSTSYKKKNPCFLIFHFISHQETWCFLMCPAAISHVCEIWCQKAHCLM